MRPASLGPDTVKDRRPRSRLAKWVTRPSVASRPQAPSTRFWVAAALGAVAAAVVVGASVYAWQHDRVSARQATIVRLGAERDRALASAVAAADLATTLEAQRAVLWERIGTLSSGRREMAVLLGGVRGQLRETRLALGETQRLLDASEAELAATQDELGVVRAEVRGLAGPALPDGTRYGRVEVVGWDQSPPRVIVDRTALTPTGMQDRVPRWIIVEVAPGATVRVARPNGSQVLMDLASFGKTFVRPTALGASLRDATYGFRVDGAAITAIWQRGSR